MNRPDSEPILSSCLVAAFAVKTCRVARDTSQDIPVPPGKTLSLVLDSKLLEAALDLDSCRREHCRKRLLTHRSVATGCTCAIARQPAQLVG